MTKHLRFLIVLLMTLVWSTGGAQTTIDFSNGLPTDWSKTGTIAKYTYDSKSGIQLQKNTSITSPAFEDAYSSMKFSLKRSGSGTTFTIFYQIGNASAVEIKTFKAADVTKSWNDYTIGIPATAQVANCKFIFKSATSSYYISSLEFTPAGPVKTATKVAFPPEYSNKTFTFTEGKLEGFTAPKATESNNVAGTITYSSNNESAVKVNASTGALSFHGYGEATITATFTPTNAETYAVSTDSYKVKNERGVVAGTITFDKANGAFENVKGGGTGYISGDFQFVSDSNESFTFKCSNVMKQDGCLQLQYKTDKQGKVESPTFPQFTNGYKVYVVYSSEQPLTLQAGDHDAIGTTTSSGSTGTGAAVSIGVPANVSFVINVGSKYAKISKIEIIPNKIDETETITLDETATTNNIEAKPGVNVTLMRTMKAGVWNTICLPFDVTKKQATAAFGEGVKIAQLDDASTGNTLNFVDMSGYDMVASTPYLIKPTIAAPTEGYKFEGVTIKANDKGNVVPDAVITKGLYGFVGVYNPVDATEDIKNTAFRDECYAAFLGDNNTIFKAAGGTMKGFRAYFAIPNGTATSALRVNIDGTATSIKNIDSEVVESNAPVYNLQGQRVDGNNLTPGIYVKAGKKFVVK